MTSATFNLTADLTVAELLRLYEQMVLIRRFELAAQLWYRKGVMPGFIHLYVGEEATAVGVCASLRRTDWITSTHRGHGHALAKGMAPRLLMAELFGKVTGCCGGRGGSMHLYDPSIGLFGTNGIVVGGNAAAVGAAISATVQGSGAVAVAFFGDGGSSHGAFHESLNFAAVQRAPVVFVCENNLYATATPLAVATLNTDIASKAAAYGMPGIAVDGNDVLAVRQVVQEAIARARSGGGPTLIEAKTYRLVGHHEGDQVVGTYRTQEELDDWKTRCPIQRLRHRLTEEWHMASGAELDAIEARVHEQIDEAVAFGRSSPEPDPATLHRHVWAEPINPPMPAPAAGATTVTQGWLDAVRDGIAEEMRREPRLIYLGEGIGERGGSFAHTKGLWQEFGGVRVIDTPICELGFTGAALGASATGVRAVADLMFAEFLFEAAGQIILQAAKLRYMSNGQMRAPLVVRAGAGAIKSAGPHHSGTYHPIWAHVPGLIVVMPSNPADAKGLMKTALRAGDPVIFLEPKGLFASKGEVPVGEHLVPFGQARVARAGTDLTIVSCGLLLPRCLEAAASLQQEGCSCEVIDLRTIVPLDVDTIAASLAKTRRLLVVDEGYAMCGIGGEIAAAMMELAFDELDAPIARLHTEAVSHPFSPVLEAAALVSAAKIVAAARAVRAGRAPAQRRAAGDRSGRTDVAAGEPAPGSGGTTVVPRDSAVEEPSRLFPDLPGSGGTPLLPYTAAGEVAPGSGGPSPRRSGYGHAGGMPVLPGRVDGEPLCMPHGDLTVTEATVAHWLKKVGDPVGQGEAVVEVETEKAVSEIESPVAGTLAEILAAPGAVVKMGQQLGTIRPKQTKETRS